MNDDGTTAAIILAAGSSSRMGGGRHKLLLPLEERPVLAHVINAALASRARPVVVVLGHQGVQVRTEVAAYLERPGIIVVENPDYLQGMSTSMRVGLATLLEGTYHEEGQQERSQSGVDSALIMLGDQPLITAQVIDALISAWRTSGKRIVAALYGGKRGNPTLFAASLFGELMEVTGDEGGRRILEQHGDEVEFVELGDAAASFDVDTWEAYQEVIELWERKKVE
jgi:molybdenum cofactor cytidylyltransferase